MERSKAIELLEGFSVGVVSCEDEDFDDAVRMGKEALIAAEMVNAAAKEGPAAEHLGKSGKFE